METGSGSDSVPKAESLRGRGSKLGSMLPKLEPFVPKRDHLNPRDLRSWAKRTGFVSYLSGEASSANSTQKFDSSTGFNAERGGLDQRAGVAPVVVEQKKEEGKDERDVEVGMYPGGEEQGHGGWSGNRPGMKVGLRDNPGFGALLYYGLQHFLSLAGSLIFIPLVMVPSMGGTDKDTATVISTMLLVSGITTILHSYFGTRLPLVQGSSFVYLAPALVISNSRDFRNLTEHKFRHIMRELQGAIIVGSVFQSILGFSGLMSLLLRLINPVVVAPTVAAVGLAFFSYGFPQAGSCVEVSIPLILLVLICTLVPLSVMITWTFAFFLTAGGAYDYRGCSPDIPSSNMLVDECRKHAYTMKHCRTDVSNAWRTAAWVRIPYPLQWGVPIFHFRTSLIMILVSLVASVDSVGTYHSASLLVSSGPPTRGVVSRGIALEGFCSMLAGLWGSAASDGPVYTGSKQFDFAINALMSMSMVVTLLVAFVLDNTVPGSREERGVYIWSRAEDVAVDPSLQSDYSLPGKCASLCCCSRCLRT
ncbi:Xanthine/uracil/vitamin C permease [Corchorus olitorius]|uniref:Xanthine/uracil/vitamin C permease n=1 Tax=Corchorus olitorius TaxID=93759 RepID=A0A1R3HRF0_9ROSI|nr:Xanthine/uracil/vitamin C permease [Corchorus olitorius]